MTRDDHHHPLGPLRPRGSNADEWLRFLTEYLDNQASFPRGLTYVAVQIAEAIEDAEMSGWSREAWSS